MTTELYRYSFPLHVPVEDIEAALLLAHWAAESLHGESQVRLDAAHFLDPDRRACVIDAGTPVGRDLNRLFVGFISRECGTDSFRAERIIQIPKDQHDQAINQREEICT
jgi:hypothetical protein